MSRIPEALVAEVVGEVSKRMSDPGYAQIAIGTFAQSHPDAGRFITAHLDDLGSGEAVMHAVFHSEVLHECLCRHLGRAITPVGFVDLDDASRGDARGRLENRQPALADYIASNLESDPMKDLVALVALAMVDASE